MPLTCVDMASLNVFRRNGKLTPADLARSLSMTLAGISRCTLGGREEDLTSFRSSMSALADSIGEHASAAEIDTIVTEALNLLREYNEGSLNRHNIHLGELKAVMRTMTETITYLSESRSRSVHQLNFVERELEQASQIDDIRLLRARITACLDTVREETVRLQSESAARSQEVRQQIDRAVKIADPPLRFGVMDGVTGLPGRQTAERGISDAIKLGLDHAVAVFVVGRLSQINAKYGRAIGDEVMLRVANHFAQHLSSATFLYRWSGPALVALMQVHTNPDEIKRAWAKAAAGRQEMNLEAKQRSIFVLVETSMSFQLVNNKTVADELFRNLDQFVAEQGDGAE